MPTAQYEAGEYIISRDGTLIGPDDPGLVEILATQGFEPAEETYDDQPEQPARFTAAVVVGENFTADKMANLERLIASRETLLKKVLGADALPIERAGGILRFPWFPLDGNAMVYSQFACALVRAAMEAKRITAREQQDCASEKFRMRTLLLKLGFIGPEFQQARKILTRDLSGNGSYARPKQEGGADNA
jgi:hypothetical protein